MYKFSCWIANTAFRSKLLTCRTLWHSRTKFSRVFFFFLKYFQYFFWTSTFYLKVFVRKWWHSIPIKILDHSDLLGHTHTKFTRVLFFFFFLLKFQVFYGTSKFYRKVFVQKRRHCSPVKILDRSDVGVFSYII